MRRIAESICLLEGSVHGGVLIRGDAALLIDAPELPGGGSIPAALAEIGVRRVEAVLLTQHRRMYSGGLLDWPGALPPVHATPGEAAMLAQAGSVWTRGEGKYHRYACLPDRFSPFESIDALPDIADAVTIEWCGFSITPVVFGALSDGDCAYVVDDGRARIAFCGGLAMVGGRIHDLYSFQKALPDMMGYHGYLGGLVAWRAGIARLRALAPEMLVPAYGDPEPAPLPALERLEARLMAYAEAYVRISAVRYYFPEEYLRGFQLPLGLTETPAPAPVCAHPAWLRRIGETTSYLLRAPSGRAVLIDCGDREAVDAVLGMLERGELVAVDACWITHAHDDHLNAAWAMTTHLRCAVWSTAAVAEVCARPEAWFLPALPDCRLKFREFADGESFEWEGFRLTAMHLPGQCVYHAGLLVERDGLRVLLCGDSFAPTGLDDYCAENRNLPGEGRGYRRCVALLHRYRVDQLVNEHQSLPFRYDEAFLRLLERGMDDREAALSELLPEDIGLGVDPQWLRAWPMEQTVTRGAVLRLSLQLTGHGRHRVRARARIPWDAAADVRVEAETTGLTSGSVCAASGVPDEIWLHMDVPLPGDLIGEWRIPFDCWLDGRYLGTYAACWVRIL